MQVITLTSLTFSVNFFRCRYMKHLDADPDVKMVFTTVSFVLFRSLRKSQSDIVKSEQVFKNAITLVFLHAKMLECTTYFLTMSQKINFK